MKTILTKLLPLLAIALSLSILFGNQSFGKNMYKAEVVKVSDYNESGETGYKSFSEKVNIKYYLGNGKAEETVVENSGLLPKLVNYKVNDKVIINMVDGQASIVDFDRTDGLIYLFTSFVIITLLIVGKEGILSFVSMFVSFFLIFNQIIPRIISGQDPLNVVIAFSFLIIPISFYFSHGFNRKTTISIIGTLIALILVGLLSNVVIGASYLHGFESEEAYFLKLGSNTNVDLKGLLLSGIVVSLIGILDDVTVAQVGTVFQIAKANTALSVRELYSRAIEVGKDHISSMVNTLILVYAGSSFPLLILFVSSKSPLFSLLNQEIIATELIKTLLGSIGIVLAIPIVTFIASVSATKKFQA